MSVQPMPPPLALLTPRRHGDETLVRALIPLAEYFVATLLADRERYGPQEAKLRACDTLSHLYALVYATCCDAAEEMVGKGAAP